MGRLIAPIFFLSFFLSFFTSFFHHSLFLTRFISKPCMLGRDGFIWSQNQRAKILIECKLWVFDRSKDRTRCRTSSLLSVDIEGESATKNLLHNFGLKIKTCHLTLPWVPLFAPGMDWIRFRERLVKAIVSAPGKWDKRHVQDVKNMWGMLKTWKGCKGMCGRMGQNIKKVSWG
jgi:hypothetical protein